MDRVWVVLMTHEQDVTSSMVACLDEPAALQAFAEAYAEDGESGVELWEIPVTAGRFAYNRGRCVKSKYGSWPDGD